MDKINIDLYDLMEIISESIIDQQEANPMGMAPFCEYMFKKYQPERSKREDQQNFHIKTYCRIDGEYEKLDAVL